MVKNMVKEYITTVVGVSIKVNGLTIKSMDMVSSSMLTEINFKEIGKMAKEQGKEFMNIQMEIFMKENGAQI